MTEKQKHACAKAALAEISSGMRIGLGTGSTAAHFVSLLGEKVAEGFECLCVPTSIATQQQAKSLNIPLATLDQVTALDVTIDGTDELDANLNLIKGGGGALLREKIVATASKRVVVIADVSKKVEILGHYPLPIEVNQFGLGVTLRALEVVCNDHAADTQGTVALTLRRDGQNAPFVTDGGHFIVDASFGRILAPEKLGTDLNAVPGVVEHGLFIGLADCAYIAGPETVEKIVREPN